MCWIPLVLGASMMVGGAVLLVRFYAGRAENRPDVAGLARTESMVLGALLVSIGFLVTVLGITGVICIGLGIA